MKFNKDMLLLYAVTDRAWVGRQTLYEQVEQALMGGATLVQLREKNLCEEDFIREAIMMRELCHKYNVALIINDNVNVALKSNADGVHVGIEDTPVAEIRKKAPTDFIIGATAKTTGQAIAAQKAGADYLGVGAVFHTGTKPDAKDVSFDTLKEICSAVRIPVVAIGGISKDNILRLSGSGICGVAVISAIFAQPDIEAAARELRQLAERTVSS